jgi:hypothetical protein
VSVITKRSCNESLVTKRDTSLSLPELDAHGQKFFRALYGETADDVQGLLDKIYPDMGNAHHTARVRATG